MGSFDNVTDFNIKVVTTADTSGLKQTSAEMQALKQQAEKLRQDQGAAALFGRIPPGGGPLKPPTDGQPGGDSFAASSTGRIGGFAIAGAVYALVNSLQKASQEIAKISEDLDKQGALLVTNAQHYSEQARNARDVNDVLKVSDETLKDMATTQKTMRDVAGEELGPAAKLSDYLQTQLLARQRAAGMGDYEAAQAENLETAFNQYQAARQRAMAELLAAEKASNQTIEEKIALIDREISEQEKLKQAALRNNDPGDYAKAGNDLLRLRKEREEDIKLKQKADTDAAEAARKAQEDAYGAASPQAQAILRNEQAARDAKAQGDERSAEQFQASADAFKQAANAADLKSYQDVVNSYGGTGPVGRTAGPGESQALVDEQERNRLAAANQPVEASPEGKVGGTGTDAQAAGLKELAAAIKNSEDAAKARHEEQTTLLREQVRAWR